MSQSPFAIKEISEEVTYTSFQEEMSRLCKRALDATHTRIGSVTLSEDQLKALSTQKNFPYLLKLRSVAMAQRPALYDIYAPTVARA